VNAWACMHEYPSITWSYAKLCTNSSEIPDRYHDLFYWYHFQLATWTAKYICNLVALPCSQVRLLYPGACIQAYLNYRNCYAEHLYRVLWEWNIPSLSNTRYIWFLHGTVCKTLVSNWMHEGVHSNTVLVFIPWHFTKYCIIFKIMYRPW